MNQSQKQQRLSTVSEDSENFIKISEREKMAYKWDDRKIKTSQNVVDILNKYLDFKTVIDLGCGKVKYPFENIVRVDGNIDADPWILADLTREHNFGKFDLVLSIEVAEHLEEKYADTFVKNLIANSDKWIVMTASNKTGTPYTDIAHLNPQNKQYWINKIQNHNFEYKEDLTNKLQKEFYQVPTMNSWFRKDLMVYERTIH